MIRELQKADIEKVAAIWLGYMVGYKYKGT